MKEQELQRKKPSYRADAAKVILILLTAIAVLAAGSWFLWTAVPDGGKPQKSPFLAVREIVVEGETRYDKEQIIQASGLFVGQSLLSVNKVQAYERIAAAFPYIESMEITNRAVDTVCVSVREATPAGAVYADGGRGFLPSLCRQVAGPVRSGSLPFWCGLGRTAGAAASMPTLSR